MSNYIQIQKGNDTGTNPLPFCIFKVPQYSNKPTNNKFKHFLIGNVEQYEERLTCSEDINALCMTNDTLFIDVDRCITCLACICSRRNPVKLLSVNVIDLLNHIGHNYFQSGYFNPSNIFNGELKQIPLPSALSLKIKSFYQYTSENELGNIALWTTIMLYFLASDEGVKIGKEIPIANLTSPRDNRLDTCCLSYDRVLVGETKTTLDSLLQENRYRIQIPSYETIIKTLVKEHNDKYGMHKQAMVLLVIGGRETDLLPSNHKGCTSVVGGGSLRFYNDIDTYKIRFISADLLWTMAQHSLITQKRLCWDKLFPEVFSNPNVLGILSGGQVVKQDKNILVEAISPKVLNSSVQDFV